MIIETTEPAKARTLLPASRPSPTKEQPNRVMEQIIQKYPAAKTNFLQGYES